MTDYSELDPVIRKRLESVPKDEMYPELKDAIINYSFDPKNPYKYRWHKRRSLPAAYGFIPFFYGFYCVFWRVCDWKSTAFGLTVMFWSMFAVTGGIHRYWTHRGYKAKTPFRLFLAFWFSVANQHDIFSWVKDHRVHHKYVDTDADPHNSQRGFLFCHALWLVVYPHPAVVRAHNNCDISDLKRDKIACMQRRLHPVLIYSLCYLIPTIIPYYIWNEDVVISYCVCALLRYATELHITSCVNSYAHFFGEKPYDKKSTATDSIMCNVFIFGLGEGWHNYHHVFPYDYRASEIPYWFNVTTLFLDILQYFGQVYDVKTAPPAAIASRKAKALMDDVSLDN